MNAINNKLTDGAASDFAALRADLAAVAGDVAAVIAQLKLGAMAELSESVAAPSARAVKTISGRIERQPLMSALIAFTAGLLLSRFLPK